MPTQKKANGVPGIWTGKNENNTGELRRKNGNLNEKRRRRWGKGG
jgi:hypothetical protein